MCGTPNYHDSDLKFFGLAGAKPTTLPGTSGLKRIQDGDEPASSEEHAAYRKAAGKLQWEVPIRPDVACSVKELARTLAHPLKEDLIKLKTLPKYMKSTPDYRFVIQPRREALRIVRPRVGS